MLAAAAVMALASYLQAAEPTCQASEFQCLNGESEAWAQVKTSVTVDGKSYAQITCQGNVAVFYDRIGNVLMSDKGTPIAICDQDLEAIAALAPYSDQLIALVGGLP